MNKHVTHQGIALSVLGVALFGLAHAWAGALDRPAQEDRQSVVQMAAIKMPLAQTSGIKGTTPSTVGQQYQGPFHYKNYVYYNTDHITLQGGGFDE